MKVKNSPFKIKSDVDWTKKMSTQEMQGAQKAITILNQHSSVIPKFERASLEKMSVLDEPKDPYSGVCSLDDEVSIDTDGTITYGIPIASGSSTMKPYFVKDYTYIIVKHVWPDKSSGTKKVKYISVIVKTYAMKIFIQSSINKLFEG